MPADTNRKSVAGRVAHGAACLGALACANEMPPPGSLPDEEPPVVRSIEPAPDSVVPGFDGHVRIRFNEPVNVPNDLGRQLIASPMEVYEVESGFSDIRIRPRGGWRDSVVYCLAIPEGISDLLRNRTPTGIQFCFSTGVPIAGTRITGTVLDAVTGQPQPEATVQFIAPPDSTPYGAVTDREGRFSLRAIPPGGYEAFGFLDRNRNFALDRALEPNDSTGVEAFEGAVPDLELRLVEPDTTPPRLLRAEAFDSLTLRLEFDDPLLRPQPGSPLVTVRDSASASGVDVTTVRVGEPAEVGLASPDSTAPDSAGVAADSLAAPPPAADTAGAGGRPLPSRYVSIRLSRVPGVGVYRVHAEGFVNLRRLSGGGDTTVVISPPATDSGAAVDTAAVADSTAAAAPDSVGPAPLLPDSSAARDTLAVALPARRRDRVP